MILTKIKPVKLTDLFEWVALKEEFKYFENSWLINTFHKFPHEHIMIIHKLKQNIF